MEGLDTRTTRSKVCDKKETRGRKPLAAPVERERATAQCDDETLIAGLRAAHHLARRQPNPAAMHRELSRLVWNFVSERPLGAKARDRQEVYLLSLGFTDECSLMSMGFTDGYSPLSLLVSWAVCDYRRRHELADKTMRRPLAHYAAMIQEALRTPNASDLDGRGGLDRWEPLRASPTGPYALDDLPNIDAAWRRHRARARLLERRKAGLLIA